MNSQSGDYLLLLALASAEEQAHQHNTGERKPDKGHSARLPQSWGTHHLLRFSYRPIAIRRTIAAMRAVLVSGVFMLVFTMTGCGGSDSKQSATTTTTTFRGPVSVSSTPTTTTTRATTASNAEIAAAAEQLVRENRLEDPGHDQPFNGPFLSYECSDWILANAPESCWEPWLNGFSYDNGTLSVALQVDRTAPFSQLQAEDAAIWFRNFISADFHGVLKPNVDEIVITDGAGTVMARQRALRK